MKKILAILPESIGGRLTMTSLFNGFKKCGCELLIVDNLDSDAENKIKNLNISDFEFIISYDFAAIKLKKELNLNIKTANYFSDVIESCFSGTEWIQYYEELKNKDNYIFYWDKELTKITDKSIKNIHYLPHAVDTDIYKKLETTKEYAKEFAKEYAKEYDIMFAGRLTHENRANQFLEIVKALPDLKFALYCYPKHLEDICKSVSPEDAKLLKSIYKGFIDSEDMMNEEINKSKIVLNFTYQGKSSLNYRVFQVLAAETLLLTDYRSELDELFTPGKDVLYYENKDDLIEKINDYIKNPEKYEGLLKNARNTVKKLYDSKIAAAKILRIITNKDD